MTDKKTELTDADLEQAAGGATWGQGSVTSRKTLGKDGVMIQNIGFPDDSGGSKFGPSGLGFKKVDVIKK